LGLSRYASPVPRRPLFTQVIAAAAHTPAHQTGALGLVLLVFGGVSVLLGSEKLRPSNSGRYAQARGRWQTFRWMRWPLLIAGGIALLAALILSV
jgi:hypothetical protein